MSLCLSACAGNIRTDAEGNECRKENEINERIAYRAALCMEEMVAYARAAEETDPKARKAESSKIRKLIRAVIRMEPQTDDVSGVTEAELNVEVMVRFKGKDSAIIVELDDGKCIALDRNELSQKLITDNCELLRKIATSVEYQYILNMNHTGFTFSEK